MRTLNQFLLVVLLMVMGQGMALAEIVIVVDARTPVSTLTQDEVINIFLGRHRRMPGGEPALPIDHPKDSQMRADFYQRLTDKSLTEINTYWARLFFSGNTRPPVMARDNAEVLAHVLNHRGGIGYVERSQIDARFRVVMTLPP